MDWPKEELNKKVIPDAPLRHDGIDVLREYLFSGAGGDFRAYAARKKA